MVEKAISVGLVGTDQFTLHRTGNVPCNFKFRQAGLNNEILLQKSGTPLLSVTLFNNET